MTDTVLIEPSFADALAAIAGSAILPEGKRSHWTCSLRRIAQAMNKPVELIPARWTSVRHPIGRLHPARVGSTAKTLANHKSNVQAALLWFAQERDVPSRGAPLTPDWTILRDKLPLQRSTRANLSGLMRFASAHGIANGGQRSRARRLHVLSRADDVAGERQRGAASDCTHLEFVR